MAHVWQHTRLSERDKYKIYSSYVVSKLTYGLQTVWLTKAARSKLDAFHVRCLRQILSIAHSHWSRISNQEVLHRIGAPKLSMSYWSSSSSF